jgi:hypothetical protein
MFISGPALGDRIFFSDIGPPIFSDPNEEGPTIAPSPLTIGSVPTIRGQIGDERSLHIWMVTDPSTTAFTQKYISISLAVESSASDVAHPTLFEWLNPNDTMSDVERWDETLAGSIGPRGDADWLTNALAISFETGSIGRSRPTRDPWLWDPGHDAITRAFYLGRLDFRIDKLGTTGLYLRNGDLQTVIGPVGPAPLQYGGNTVDPPYDGGVFGVGDPITADLALADAFVVGVPEPATATLAVCLLLALPMHRVVRRCCCNSRCRCNS